MSGEPTKPGGFIKRAMVDMQEIARRMVDVEQHSVELPPWPRRVEASPGVRNQWKEIAVKEAATCITDQFRAKRDQATLMPLDDRIQRLNHDQ